MRLRKNKNDSFFHPFEIAFCGFSNSGKTTLISKIIKNLSREFDIGYLKHDAHKFQMDKPGKDTATMSDSGAKSVLINDEAHFANIEHSSLEQFDVMMKMSDMDFLFIEGHKFSKLPKLVLLSSQSNFDETIKLIKEGEISDVMGIITDIENAEEIFENKYPIFNRDNIDSISNFILSYFKEKMPTKINGLILTGGKSERMKEDKGALNYHGEQNQIEHSQELLSSICDEVYVSCRKDQLSEPFLKNQKTITDSFPSVGPTTGILSAQFFDPNAAWLVLACDLPYLNLETIEHLKKNRNSFKLATAFINPKRNWPEPLCTIYEPKSYQKLMKYFSVNKPCPRKVLFNSNIESLEMITLNALDNVNTPKEREEALEYINKGKADES